MLPFVKTLLIVYHTGGVKTATMAEAVERGARAALSGADAEGESLPGEDGEDGSQELKTRGEAR